MARGKLDPPNLDDRDWQQIRDEALELARKHTPEWTDFTPSDLGVTLVELFAWLVEGMIYRLNRVPEKNYIHFLELLGITRDPATPATTLLTFRLEPGASALELPAGQRVATVQTEESPRVVFQTDEAIAVVPTNLLRLLVQPPGGIRADISRLLVGHPAPGKPGEAPLAGWKHAENVDSGETVAFYFGFDGGEPESIDVRIGLLGQHDTPLEQTWRVSDGDSNPDQWPKLDAGAIRDATGAFRHSGRVGLTLPSAWTATDFDSTAGLFWLRLEITNNGSLPRPLHLQHLLVNSALATNAPEVASHEANAFFNDLEYVGQSDGAAFQAFELRQRPIFRRPHSRNPYDHVRVFVREPQIDATLGSPQEWTLREDLPEGDGAHFLLDPVTGTIRFGDFDPTAPPDGAGRRRHGRIPPKGSHIGARYRYVAGGAVGNVAAGTVTQLEKPVPLLSVSNPGPAAGGSDEEDVEETKRRAPQILRIRNRAVTAADFEYLAREATTDVKKARCLQSRYAADPTRPELPDLTRPWNFGSLNRSAGHVTVIIVPDVPSSDPDHVPRLAPQPTPPTELVREVQQYLSERRTTTVTLTTTGPRYLKVKVRADVRIFHELSSIVDVETLQSEVEQRIRRFLHPLVGGPAGTGWDVGQDLSASGLVLALQQTLDNRGYLHDLAFVQRTPDYPGGVQLERPPGFPPASNGDENRVLERIADYELICSHDTHDVVVRSLDANGGVDG